jgi:hypothetical protein
MDCEARFIQIRDRGFRRDRNPFPDLLARWAVRPKGALAFGKIARLLAVSLAPMDCEEFDWLSIEDILNSRRAETVPVPDSFTPGVNHKNVLALFPGVSLDSGRGETDARGAADRRIRGSQGGIASFQGQVL